MIETDICIVGAGPSGISTALHLSYLGKGSMVIDKATFPRDKICGDGISGKVPDIVKELDPKMFDRFNESVEMHVGTWGMRMVAQNSNVLEFPFFIDYDTNSQNPPGYICRRKDFDNFFVEEARRREDIEIKEGVQIENFEKIDNGFIISNRDKSVQIKTRLLILADGANSRFSRNVAQNKKDPKHHAAAVRAYFTNVKGLHKDNFVEFYFLDKVVPGYLWIFSHSNGQANVGMGMRSDFIKKNGINLNNQFLDIIENHPIISPRFKEAKMDGQIAAHHVPIGSKRRNRSGENYMLVGDAAHLVDPLTGGGISNSFFSGKLAAEKAVSCFEKNDFSEEFLDDYDKKIHKEFGVGMQVSYYLQNILRYPKIVTPVINWLSKRPKLFDRLSKLQMALVAGKDG